MAQPPSADDASALPTADASNRSPSPTSAPPLALTPGPLAQRLAQVFQGALGKTLQACSYENFAACFPTPAQKQPKVLRAVWTQIVGKIETKANVEFEEILKERKVVEGLNALEQYVQEAKRRRERAIAAATRGGDGNTKVEEPVPAHEVPAQELYEAHLSPLLEPIQDQLREQLRKTQERNLELAQAVRRQREEVERIVSSLEMAMKDLEGANAVLDDAVDEDFRTEVMELQQEASGTTVQ